MSDLIGTWKYSYLDGGVTRYTFRDDGILNIQSPEGIGSGKYSISSDYIIINNKPMFNYSVTDTTLWLTPTAPGARQITLKRE
jgi:hypothetical protein